MLTVYRRCLIVHESTFDPNIVLQSLTSFLNAWTASKFKLTWQISNVSGPQGGKTDIYHRALAKEWTSADVALFLYVNLWVTLLQLTISPVCPSWLQSKAVSILSVLMSLEWMHTLFLRSNNYWYTDTIWITIKWDCIKICVDTHQRSGVRTPLHAVTPTSTCGAPCRQSNILQNTCRTTEYTQHIHEQRNMCGKDYFLLSLCECVYVHKIWHQ